MVSVEQRAYLKQWPSCMTPNVQITNISDIIALTSHWWKTHLSRHYIHNSLFVKEITIDKKWTFPFFSRPRYPRHSSPYYYYSLLSLLQDLICTINHLSPFLINSVSLWMILFPLFCVCNSLKYFFLWLDVFQEMTSHGAFFLRSFFLWSVIL